jgi:hypothetical protein
MTIRGTPPIHETLVNRLKADLPPVPRLWPPTARLASWFVLAAGVLAVAAAVGLRQDLGAQLHRPLYLFQIAALLAAAALAAAAALRAAVPGYGGERRRAGLAVALGLVGTALLLGEPETGSLSPVVFIASGVRCAACVAMFGLLPWVALFLAIGRTAPLDGRAAGRYAGGAAFLIGATAVRLACPIDEPAHLLTSHVAPVLLWSSLSALAGAAWLVRWRTGSS